MLTVALITISFIFQHEESTKTTESWSLDDLDSVVNRFAIRRTYIHLVSGLGRLWLWLASSDWGDPLLQLRVIVGDCGFHLIHLPQ